MGKSAMGKSAMVAGGAVRGGEGVACLGPRSDAARSLPRLALPRPVHLLDEDAQKGGGAEALHKAVTIRTIEVRGTTTEIPLKMDEAPETCAAFAMSAADAAVKRRL